MTIIKEASSRMAKALAIIFLFNLLAACSTTGLSNNLSTQNSYRMDYPFKVKFQHLERVHLSKTGKKNINDYVQTLVQDLFENMEYITDKDVIGITHLALLDSQLKTTNLLSMQISESMLHEFHKFRIPVVDIKSTGFIRVTPDGDFLLSRNHEDLPNTLPINYVLTGTLVRHREGYLINARVIGVASKAVVATSQQLLPHSITSSIMPTSNVLIVGKKAAP